MDQLKQFLIDEHQSLVSLALALALGALIGLQRGWKDREREPGQRIAGIRTHALVGLTGGLIALIAERTSHWLIAVGFICLTLTATVFYYRRSSDTDDISITGLTGLLLTYLFGVTAVLFDASIAASAAVVTALILDNKDEIHRFLMKIEQHELSATLKLLLISVVLLPILPDKGFGPNQSINPYEIWWLVVLIATISFVGHLAIRIGGPAKGILFSGFFAGLSSSTAITLHFSRLSHKNQSLAPVLAAGILAACGTMFPRILLFCALLNPGLFDALWLPMALMGLTLYTPACWLWFHFKRKSPAQAPELTQQPLDLKYALVFGGVLAIIMLLGNWLKTWFGDGGIYLLAATSGITDVDAITLSLAKLSNEDLVLATAANGIIIASTVNNLIKGGLAAILGDGKLKYFVAVPLLLAIVLGVISKWLW